jgi:hypothetical protein
MRKKIKIKTKIYLDNLRSFLGVSSLNKITKNDIKLIAEYLQRYPEPEIFCDLLNDLLDFKYVIKSAIKNMEIIYKGIIKSGQRDVDSLKDIVLNINLLINKYNISEKDKKKIFDLMTDYNRLLDEKLKGNNDLINLIYGGSTILLSILTYAFYKALGGKKPEDILTNTTNKLQKNIKFIDNIRIIGTKA